MLVQIDYELRFDTPFHLGTGIANSQIDRTVIRDAENYLYVPASTFKGVTREYCEQLCRFYLTNEKVDDPHDPSQTLEQFSQAPSLITRIFGSSLYAGGLRFDNARLTTVDRNQYGEQKNMLTSIATQARIDRVTRIAVDQALYTSEFGNPDLVFQGTIKGALQCTPVELFKAETPTPSYSLLLLIAGLLMVERLGGNKSAGKGQCRCTITRILIDKQLCPEEQWEAWIEQLDRALATYTVNEKEGQL